MKHAFLFLLAAASLVACNNSGDSTSKEGDTTKKMDNTKVASSTSTTDMPYPLKEWGDWQPGSMDNLKTALQSLKDYENGDIDACLNKFADSIHLSFDGMEGTFTKDSVRKMFTAERKANKAYKIDMDDYETVKSKNGKQEYVSMWYKQKWQDQKGNWDSIANMDDLKMINGKVASIDGKSRHFPKKKM